MYVRRNYVDRRISNIDCEISNIQCSTNNIKCPTKTVIGLVYAPANRNWPQTGWAENMIGRNARVYHIESMSEAARLTPNRGD
jgi:hypothetical protein